MTSVGVIHWGGLSGNSALHDANVAWLSPNAYHGRNPTFMTLGSNTTSGREDTQGLWDAALDQAGNCGIDYIAYNLVPDEQGFFGFNIPNSDPYATWIGSNNALTLHLSSTRKTKTKICLNLICNFGTGVPVNGDSSGWPNVVSYIVGVFQDPAYMFVTVSGVRRPLLYFYDPDGFVTSPWGSSTANAATAVAALRTATTSAGLNTPYIVGLSSFSTIAALGLDAAGDYVVSPTSTNESYATYKAAVEALWVTRAGSFAHIVPVCSNGVDFNPVSDAGALPAGGTGPGESSPGNYSAPPTDAQMAAHLQAGLDYVAANSTTCNANTMLYYAWSEPTECTRSLRPIYNDYGSGLQALAKQMGRQRDNRGAYRARGISYVSR